MGYCFVRQEFCHAAKDLMSRALDMYLRLQILEYFFTVLIYKIFRPELVLKLDIYTLSESTIIVRFVSKMSKHGPNI